MPKSSKKKLDQAMAHERNKLLSPFLFTYKHVKLLKVTGRRFIFTYTEDDQVYYDCVDVCRSIGGVRLKPEIFILPDVVRQRLVSKVYNRWYFEDDDYLYPMQICKISTLLDAFIWKDDPLPQHSCALIDPETMYLRKKPLVAMREPFVGWPELPPKRGIRTKACKEKTQVA